MAERAHPSDPLWRRRYLFFPTPALKYLIARYRICRPYVHGRRVLDIPCGNGMGYPFLRSSSFLAGVDRDIGATRFAAARFRGYTGIVADMASLPFASDSFGAVICLEGIEHVDRSTGLNFLGEAHRVLQKDGWFVLSCPTLGSDARHSGNLYHLYEWREHDLLEAVDGFFQVEFSKAMQGPAGGVRIIVAKGSRRHETRLKTRPSKPDGRYEKALQSAREWVGRQWSGPQARFWAGGEVSLLATNFAILAEETLGTLPVWTERQTAAVASHILDYQSEKTGKFGVELVHDEDLLAPSVCDAGYVIHQITYFCLSALTALGLKPRHRLSFALPFLDHQSLVEHFADQPWNDAWNMSNRIMFAMRYLIHLMEEPELAVAAQGAFDKLLSLVEDRQDARTGLWFSADSQDLHIGVYAAYHFIPFLLWRGRPLKHVDEMIDSVLAIQSSEGLFAEWNGGGACEDLDAIDLLVKLSSLSEHRTGAVDVALRRAFDRILQLQQDDGGFPNYLQQPSVISWKRQLAKRLRLGHIVDLWRPIPADLTHYSGWAEVWAPRGKSDIWGTWFRTLALNLIVEKLPQLGPPRLETRFHSLPALGWHETVIAREGKSRSPLLTEG